MKQKLIIHNDTYLQYSETFIYDHVMGVASEFDVHFLTHKTQNLDRFPHPNVHEFTYGLREKIRKVYDPFTYHPHFERQLQQFIQSIEPIAIHSHFGNNGLKISPIAKRLGIPHVMIFYGVDASKRLKNKRYVRLLRDVFDHSIVLCNSGQLKRNLVAVGLPGDKIKVHYLGVEPEKFPFIQREPIARKRSKGDKVVFLQVSRFVEKKGHSVTIEAFSQLLRQLEDPEKLELWLVGDGPLLSRSQKQVRDLGITDNVRFLGVKTMDEVRDVMARADIMVQHSITSARGDMEGLPMILMQGMASGLPVISTNHSGIPELVSNSKDGYLVEEKDLHSYVKAMRIAVELKDNRMGVYAREKVETSFNLHQQNRKLIDLYLNLSQK